MKKLIMMIALLASFSFGLFAAENAKEGWSDISYVNVPILKILEAREGYVIIYQKNKVGVGNTVIPKSWAQGDVENPAKLKLRKLEPGKLEPFMTIVKKGDSFHRVILTVPMNKQHSIWSVSEVGRELEGLDKTNMDDVKL